MLILSGFKTKMPGMNILLFVSQAQSNFNFVILAGCLIIESLAMASSSHQQLDYGWILHSYIDIGLPRPSVVLSEQN